MDLHGLDRDEERLGELLVAHAFGRHPGDPALAGRQSVHPGEDQLAGPRARRRQLLLGSSDQAGCAGPVGQLQPLAQRRLGVPAPVAAAQSGAEVDQRPRVLDLGLGASERRDRLTEQRLALAAALDQPERPQRDPDRPRRPPPAGPLELLLGELEGLGLAAEPLQGQRGLGAPGRNPGLSKPYPTITRPTVRKPARACSSRPASRSTRARP
jgi:hypothetical protein